MAGILILSLTINAAVIGTLGYHYFMKQPQRDSLSCFSTGNGHLYQSLGLTGGQLERMGPLAHAFHGQMDEMKASVEQKKDLLIDLLQRGEEPDKIDALRRELASIQDTIQKEVISHIADIKQILNSNQQEQFFRLMRQSMNCTGTSMSSPSGGNR
ncbi:MAG: periplasmic heavy metal sensor [Deltaproteobacteria bacterium]|nr:periplasmic heavy metal sensor [Deltaproteobacteria bacterium]